MTPIDNQLPKFAAHLREQGYRERTIEEYGKVLRRSAASGDLLSEALRPEVSRQYARIARCAALAFARWLGQDAYELLKRRCDAQPHQRTVQQLPPDPLSDDEWSAWRQQVPRVLPAGPVRVLLTFMWSTGARIGDALQLERQAVLRARSTGSLTTPAKGGRLAVYTWAPLRELLEQLPVEQGGWEQAWELVSTSHKSAEGVLRRAVRRVARAAGIHRRIYPHLLHHTVAYRAVEATGDLHLASRLLQHSSTATTEVYTRRRSLRGLSQLMDDVQAHR